MEMINIEPDWKNLAEWHCRAFSDHSFEKFAKTPVGSFIEIIRYLTQTDPEFVATLVARWSDD